MGQNKIWVKISIVHNRLWCWIHRRSNKMEWLSSYYTCNIIFFSTKLTWRDVQHIIANSARAAPGGVFLERGEWQQNKAGFYFSKYYGFGLMDAGRMVNLAKNWTQVPRQRKCKIEGSERYMQGFILHSFWLCLHSRPHEIFESYRTYRTWTLTFRYSKIFSRDSLRPYTYMCQWI